MDARIRCMSGSSVMAAGVVIAAHSVIVAAVSLSSTWSRR